MTIYIIFVIFNIVIIDTTYSNTINLRKEVSALTPTRLRHLLDGYGRGEGRSSRTKGREERQTDGFPKKVVVSWNKSDTSLHGLWVVGVPVRS